jgi:hypothetical protein
MKLVWIVGILTLFAGARLSAQTDASVKEILTDPNLSTRCKELTQERNDKVKIRQRLSGLLQRNQNLLKQTPSMRTAMRSRLESNKVTVRNELYLSTLQVQSMEETIIRSGCPGINL